MLINYQDTAVQSALISAAATIISTVFAAICAAIIGKKIADRDKLRVRLKLAINDIAFLLAVEEAHINTCETPKILVRQKVTASTGIIWSGKFTPGRAKSLDLD